MVAHGYYICKNTAKIKYKKIKLIIKKEKKNVINSMLYFNFQKELKNQKN